MVVETANPSAAAWDGRRGHLYLPTEGGTALSKAPRELDLINAVPAVTRAAGQQVDAVGKAILELPTRTQPRQLRYGCGLPRCRA